MNDTHSKTYTRSLFIGAILVIVAATAVIIWLSSRDQSNSNQEVVIAQAGNFFLYAPLYVAADADYFTDEGIDVQIVSTGGDDKTWAAVISGSAQFGIADPTFVAIAADRGQPGKVIGSIVNGVPFWGVTFKENIGEIQKPADLKGYTVATFSAPSTAYTLQKQMFLDAELEPQIRQGAFGTILAMLRSGTADIGLELEPSVSQAISEGAHVVYSLSDMYGDFAVTGLTAAPSYLEEHPDVAQKVLCALQRAANLIQHDPDAALSILQKRFPEIDANVAREALKRVVEDRIIPQTLILSEDAWRKAVTLRRDAGDLTGSGDFENFVNNRYADWAAKNCKPDTSN